uniref:Transcriptional modulator of MazE/toxin, MazF n=1 Tax=Loigolactobacillus rennini TaxID=238013 RepID=A0A1K2I7T6_9LACO|nr:transcriptional modulator of MazE/toxin, MazF [Loigolactobacillus rennini]
MVTPKQGDLIFINAEPHAGREEGGHNPKRGNIRRPMVVLSNDAYNRLTGLILGMPITSKIKTDQRLYLTIDEKNIHGSIITFQLQNYDFTARKGQIVAHISDHALLNELINRAKNLL